MISLSKMNSEEFNRYMEMSIDNYAKQLEKSGAYKKEECLRESKKTFNRFLPKGLDTKGHNVMNIINDKNENIGMIWYGPKGNTESDEAFIYDFSIMEKYRGKGFGKESMRLLEEYAKDNNYKKISLHVFGHNKRAVGLYEKMGYEAYSMHMSKDI